MTDSLIFTGTGDSLGVPRVYCDCAVCTEARTTGVNRRLRCSAVLASLTGTVWLDCGPDWRAQMEALRWRRVTHVLVTHAHHDHIAGLPELSDVARWTRRDVPAPQVIGPAPVLEVVKARFPWVERHLDLVPLTGTLQLHGYEVTAWEVGHGRNGTSFAYRFSQRNYAWAYCPDSFDLHEAERAPLRGLDVLVLGTAHFQETAPFERRSLYDMVEASDLLTDVRPKRAVFTHLSHTVDLRRAYPLPQNVTIARDGLRLTLSAGASSHDESQANS